MVWNQLFQTLKITPTLNRSPVRRCVAIEFILPVSGVFEKTYFQVRNVIGASKNVTDKFLVSMYVLYVLISRTVHCPTHSRAMSHVPAARRL